MSHTPVTDWIFDLDNTLYPGGDVLFGQIVSRITKYISRYLSLHPREALQVQKHYLAEYGTSLSGMMAVHGMDPADFLDYVHDIDLTALKPNPCLAKAIKALPGRKFVFTNGSRAHARNITGHLGLKGVFDGLFALEDMDYIPKPRPEAYDRFNRAFDIDPDRALMVEDMARNLKLPKAQGMRTLLITSEGNYENEPPDCRPLSGTDIPEWVDWHTSDLAAWLEDWPRRDD